MLSDETNKKQERLLLLVVIKNLRDCIAASAASGNTSSRLHDIATTANHQPSNNTTANMESNTLVMNRMVSSDPYECIDTGWISQRINERATVRRSKLASYFDGFMEFSGRPPPLSRSPSPDLGILSWQADPLNTQTRNSSSLANPRDEKWGGKGTPRNPPTRRSTTESDSDPGYPLHTKRRREFMILSRVNTHTNSCGLIGYMTPLPQQKNEHRTHSRKSKQASRRMDGKASETLSLHAMKTRSKSRGKVPTHGSSRSLSKLRSRRRKVS